MDRTQHPHEVIKLTTTGILVIAAYIAAQMLADVLSLKIALVASFSVDAGTVIYPITFTLRDMVHKLLGRSAARTVIVVAAVINLAMASLFLFAAWLPPDPSWLAERGWSSDWFAAVLNPAWRIVLASIAAEVVSELTDTEVYHLWVTRVAAKLRFARRQWTRVLVSNAVSVPLDSLVFCWGAFGGLYDPAIVWSIFWANILVKGIVTLVSLPGIYLVPSQEAAPEKE